MKKLIVSILWLCTLFIVWNATQAKDYEYRNLNITADILKDWTINVIEDYTADFFVNKHGIIRDIPFNYSVDWKRFHIDISKIDVIWKKFTTSENTDKVSIKIGDANKTINWIQEYPISYSVYWLIRNFSWAGYAELYRNLVGYDFDTNINKVRAELILPGSYDWFTWSDFKITTDWKRTTVEWFEWEIDWSWWDRIIITYDKPLQAYHGITLAVKLPVDMFEFDHKKQASLIWWKEKSNRAVAGEVLSDAFWWIGKGAYDFWKNLIVDLGPQALIIFIIIYIAFYNSISNKTKKIDLKEWELKWKFKKQFPVIVQYFPPKWINSAEAWLLIHRKAQANDLFSLVYKWLVEKIVKIEWDTNDWSVVIRKLKNIWCDVPEYENAFFGNLLYSWMIRISENENLYRYLSLGALEEYWDEKWWFKEWITSKKYLSVLFFVLPFIILPASILLWYDSWVMPFICIMSIAVWVIFAMESGYDKKNITEEWARIVAHLLWYREFIAKCEEDQLRFLLKEDPLYFDKTLPYAVAFWLETELIYKMQRIGVEPPINVDTLIDFSDIMNSVSSHTSEPISSSSSWGSSSSSYDSDSWFDSWSSFDSDSSFSSWWGGGWWGWSSW